MGKQDYEIYHGSIFTADLLFQKIPDPKGEKKK